MTWVCPSVDTDAFRKNCSVPLVPNQWNAWRLIRTNRDAPTQAQIDHDIWYVMRWWLRQIDPNASVIFAPFDNLQATPEAPAPNMKLLANATDASRRKCFDGLIVVREEPNKGPAPVVWVSFVYRGTATQMPWPAYKINEFGVEDWCPVDADWALYDAWTWQEGHAPPVPDVKPWYHLDMPSVIDPTQSVTGLLFWGGVGVIAASIVANRLLGDK